MNRWITLVAVLALCISACDSQSPQVETQNRVAQAPALELRVDAPAHAFSKADNDVNAFLAALNAELAASGLNIAVERAEFVTVDDGSAEAGQTVYANDRTKRLDSRWVPGDPRRDADGNDITYLNYSPLMAANGSIDAEPPIDASFATFNDVTCTGLNIVKRPDTGVFPSAIFAGGDPFVADIVELGFLPGVYFELVLGPGTSEYVLGVTFTFIFGSFDAEGNFTPSDVDGDGRYDTALKEVWYNDDFTWTDAGTGGIDIETVALHENGHALEMGHFGKIFTTGKPGSLKLHVAPRAVMNAIILGELRDLLGTDNAAYCGNFASWPTD